MIKKLFEHISIGLSVGFVCTTLCMWIFGAYQASGFVVMRMFTVWLFASVLYSVISIVYDTDIPFPVTLIIHFIACFAVTFIASSVSGIFELIGLKEWFIYVMPVFILIYVIIGTVTTVISNYQTKKINEKIKK